MDPLPPDPYAVLNVPKDATAAAIKTAYRKAALKCHPDKVPDKADEFHQLSQAYEILCDEDKRRDYDDEVRLRSLRREVHNERRSGSGSFGGPNVDVRTAAFEMRSSPGPATSFYAKGPSRVYEERRPSRSYDDDLYDGYFDSRPSSRKNDGYKEAPRRSPTQKAPRAEEVRSKSSKTETKPQKETKERERNVKQKQRDKETNRDRGRKYAFVDDDNDSDQSDEGFYDDSRKRRDDIEAMRASEERRQREAREYMNLTQETGPYNDSDQYASDSYPRDPKYSVRKGSSDARPAMVRKNPSHGSPKESPRRSSRTHDERRGERSSPDVSDGPDTLPTRRAPPLQSFNSSPDKFDVPDFDGRTSRGQDAEYETRSPPRMARAETMPSQSSKGSGGSKRPNLSRRTGTGSTPVVSSNLRNSETTDSGYNTGSPTDQTYPDTTPQASSTKYYYGSERDREGKDKGSYNGHPTVTREPGRTRKSPSPEPAKPSQASKADRSSGSRSASYSYSNDRDAPASGGSSSKRPSVSRTESGRNRVPQLARGATMPTPSSKSANIQVPPLRTGGISGTKDRPLFGEVTSSPVEMDSPMRRIPEDSVRYAKKLVPEDVRYGPGFRDSGYGGSGGGRTGRRTSEDVTAENARAHMAAAVAAAERRGSADSMLPRQPRRAETFA